MEGDKVPCSLTNQREARLKEEYQDGAYLVFNYLLNCLSEQALHVKDP
jgi:hypothetical protein